MTSEAATLSTAFRDYSTTQSIEQTSIYPFPFMETIERMGNFVYECIFKEFGSCLSHLWYRGVFWIDPNIHGLDPVALKFSNQVNQTAKVLLLMHGSGAGPSSFIPLAKKLAEAGIENVYTVSLDQTEEDPVPVASLAARIQEITKDCLESGYRDVEFALVGHSLGALVGSKYIWRGVHQIDHVKISMMISIAGRLKYVLNAFSWFCEDVKPEIEETFKAMSQDLKKSKLYTIWGDQDAVVPEQSVHIQGKPSREYTVEGWGHGGVILAPEVHTQVVSWTQKWLGTGI